ncbi:M3 family metallopeptidase [Silvimonas sp.]|uniref:M3 family metallopeptidase n=1 Tax=Silvimonas sp. TaxID=2650811 RepID=UPI002842A9D4|nr:M3 family metallopeptidase [Silvimonas sp.]MDR3427409.1 M3 family metallopeptidase [Silvimonas sp.]
MTQTNPLLDFSGLPRYAEIRPEHITPALDVLLHAAAQAVKAAEVLTNPTWDSFVVPLDQTLENLGRAWGTVGHLESVVNTPELREAYNGNIPRISNFFTELAQNEALYAHYKTIAASPEYTAFTEARRVVIDHALRDFRLSGAELPAAQKERFKEIAEKLSELTTRFSQNVLDATDEFALFIDDAKELDGLPADNLAAARAAAQADDKPGYMLTLKMPSYFPVMQYATNRALREKLYRAYATRAAEFGKDEWNNSPLIEQIHTLRQEAAALLGFANFGQESLATKMADSPAEVLDFLRDLGHRAKPFMQADRVELLRFAQDELGLDTLESWDQTFVAEKLREARYAFSEQEVKQYFTEPTVIAGLFHLVETLYGLQFVAAEAPVWHPDVRYFELRNKDGSLVGGLYMDMYAREGKQGGAWMNEVRSRHLLPDGSVQTPVALIVCNFAQGVDGKPALLPHDDVITLFHETGHALHHLLTEVDERDVSGINGVEWDAVELPSQFMENFCWEWQLLPQLTKHVETGESLPEPLFEKMLAAKNFLSGTGMIRQIVFSIFDMELHMDTVGPQALQRYFKLLTEFDAPAVPEYHRFPNSFSHIFAGGYAAGYYSYKWAEVLSADAYAAFEESGVLNPQTGARFRQEVLARGGSRPALESFIAFRGRAPQTDALLRHNGLTS